MKTTLTLPALSRPLLTPGARPMLVAAGLLAAALLGGAAMQHGVDRLEAAAHTRATLERQSAALHERYTVMPPTTPALSQLRDDYDDAIEHAASLARWSIWGSLAGLGLIGALATRPLRRERQALRAAAPLAPVQPVSPQATTEAAAAPLQAPPAALPVGMVGETPSPSLDDIAREMREVSALIGGWAGPITQGQEGERLPG